MPTTLGHIVVGLCFVVFFLLGTIFPDIEYTFQKGFFKNKCYRGMVEEANCSGLKPKLLHNLLFWICLTLFVLGGLIHVVSDVI